jgi:hypothetical protein
MGESAPAHADAWSTPKGVLITPLPLRGISPKGELIREFHSKSQMGYQD